MVFGLLFVFGIVEYWVKFIVFKKVRKKFLVLVCLIGGKYFWIGCLEVVYSGIWVLVVGCVNDIGLLRWNDVVVVCR